MELHGVDDEAPLQAKPPAPKYPYNGARKRAATAPKNRKVQVMRENHVTMYKKPELTEGDMSTIRQAVASSRLRPGSARHLLTPSGKENLEMNGQRTVRYTPVNGTNGTQSVLRGTTTDGGYAPRAPGTPYTGRSGVDSNMSRGRVRMAWQDSTAETPIHDTYTDGAYGAYNGEYNSNVNDRASNMSQINGVQFDDMPKAPYAYNDRNGGFTPLHNGTPAYGANGTPSYGTNGVQTYGVTTPSYGTNGVQTYGATTPSYQNNGNQYRYGTPHHGDLTPKSVTSTYRAKLEADNYAGGYNDDEPTRTERNVTFAENIDSSRLINSNRYTPQPPPFKTPDNYTSYTNDVNPSGGIRVSVDCNPDTEIYVKVTPGSADGSVEQQQQQHRPLMYKRSKTYNRNTLYQPIPVNERLPWR